MIPGHTRQAYTKLGDSSHSVWALQLWLKAVGYGVEADGVFGPTTDQAVRNYQRKRRLVVDGIAGGKTQRALVTQICAPMTNTYRLPKYLFTSLCLAESSFILGEVNWDTPPGVDCGLVQDRVTWAPAGGPEDIPAERWEEAFGPASAEKAMQLLRARYDTWRPKYPSHSNRRLWELSVLYHNWESGALALLRGQTLSNEVKPADRWPTSVGVPGVDTYAKWAEFYIAKATQAVDWTGV